MAGRVQDRQPDVARLVLIAIHQRHIGKTRARGLVEQDRSTGGRGQLARTRNVIRLDVRLQDVADPHALFGGRLEIGLDVVLWVHHSARMCAAYAVTSSKCDASICATLLHGVKAAGVTFFHVAPPSRVSWMYPSSLPVQIVLTSLNDGPME